MPEFQGTSEALSFQAALEEAVRKAYTAHERRSHTEPLFGYVVKRISGHLRNLTVVIETVSEDAAPEAPATPAEPAAARRERTRSEPTGEPSADPIRQLLDKQQRNEPLTPNEQALLDLLRQDPGKGRS